MRSNGDHPAGAFRFEPAQARGGHEDPQVIVSTLDEVEVVAVSVCTDIKGDLRGTRNGSAAFELLSLLSVEANKVETRLFDSVFRSHDGPREEQSSEERE
jgi:hypothetical protein